MTRIEPLDLHDVPDLADVGRTYQAVFGFVPNGLRIMARSPAIAAGFLGLRRAVYDPEGRVPVELKNLVGHMASKVAGCRYCQAHTVFGAERAGAAAERLAAVWDYRASDLFDARERAALDLAVAAAAVPNAVTDELFAEVRLHWDDDEVVEILAVVALYGFLNRWNDSLATTLEEPSRASAANALGELGWHPGKHLGGP